MQTAAATRQATGAYPGKSRVTRATGETAIAVRQTPNIEEATRVYSELHRLTASVLTAVPVVGSEQVSVTLSGPKPWPTASQ